jgi:2-oxoglutarate dehydrogenase complex dehydrogenase (E1) component-like enzyme
LADELDKYRNADTYKWAQEEPQNAGMWDYVAPRFSRLSAPVRLLHFTCRSSATIRALPP